MICHRRQPDAPAPVLSNSLGTTLEMWDAGGRAVRQPPPDPLRHARPWRQPCFPGPYRMDGPGPGCAGAARCVEHRPSRFCGISMAATPGCGWGARWRAHARHCRVQIKRRQDRHRPHGRACRHRAQPGRRRHAGAGRFRTRPLVSPQALPKPIQTSSNARRHGLQASPLKATPPAAKP